MYSEFYFSQGQYHEVFEELVECAKNALDEGSQKYFIIKAAELRSALADIAKDAHNPLDIMGLLIKAMEKACQEASQRGESDGLKKEEAIMAVSQWYQDKVKDNPLLFHKRFEDIVHNAPHHVAVIYNEQELTYQELNQRINKLSHALIEFKEQNGLPNGTCIALLFENSIEAVISILAVMKAGLAYMPITVNENERVTGHRIRRCLILGNVLHVLVQDSLLNSTFMEYIPNELIVLPFDDMLNKSDNIKNPSSVLIDANQLAYIMFSSGSTAEPKGIKIAHRGLCYPVDAVKKIFSITQKDRVGWHSLLTFDASLLDIMTALGTGAALVIIPQNIRTDSRLGAYLQEKKVNIITLVPGILATLDPDVLPDLRGYISTGERGREEVFNRWLNRKNGAPPIIINGIGHTEASICTALARYDGQKLHIGADPIAGLNWFILDSPDNTKYDLNDDEFYLKNPKRVEEGELYLAGPGLALGYTGNEVYQKRFRDIPHPDNPDISIRVYQTGDLVRRNEDETLCCLGRLDRQFKYMGELVSAEGMEAAIREFKIRCTIDGEHIIHKKEITLVSEVRVLLEPTHPKQNTDYYVSAFIELNSELPEQFFDKKVANELNFFLKHHSCCTFVPSQFKLINSARWPRNENNKIDLKKLRENSDGGKYKDKTTLPGALFRMPPEETIEQELAGIWQDVLPIPTEYAIGMDDSFSGLGGTSLTFTMLDKQIKQKYEQKCENEVIFYRLHLNMTLRECVTVVSLALGKMNNFKPVRKINIQEPAKADKVILVHSVLGVAKDDFRSLIQSWKEFPEYSLYITESPSLTAYGYRVHSLEDLASDYLKYLYTLLGDSHNEGTLTFIGFSAGATLAYEMTKQCQASKYNAFCICIDTPSVEYYKKCSRDAYLKELHGLLDQYVWSGPIVNLTVDDRNKAKEHKNFGEYGKNEQLPIYWNMIVETLNKKHGISDDFEELDQIGEKYKKGLGLYNTIANFILNYVEYTIKSLKEGTGLLIVFPDSKNKRGNARLSWPDDIPLYVKETGTGSHMDFFDPKKVDWVKTEIVPLLKEFLQKNRQQLDKQREQLTIVEPDNNKSNHQNYNKVMRTTYGVTTTMIQDGTGKNLMEANSAVVAVMYQGDGINNLPDRAFTFPNISNVMPREFLSHFFRVSPQSTKQNNNAGEYEPPQP